MGRPGKKSIVGGNTALFVLKNGKYIKAKNITGGGIFGNIMKHINKHKSKLFKIGSSVGSKVLNVAKTQLKKPENRKLLKNVADQLIDKVADNISKKTVPDQKTSSNKRSQYAEKRQRNKRITNASGKSKKGYNLQKDILSITKKEAKKVAKKKSKDLVDGFAKYIELK